MGHRLQKEVAVGLGSQGTALQLKVWFIQTRKGDGTPRSLDSSKLRALYVYTDIDMAEQTLAKIAKRFEGLTIYEGTLTIDREVSERQP